MYIVLFNSNIFMYIVHVHCSQNNVLKMLFFFMGLLVIPLAGRAEVKAIPHAQTKSELSLKLLTKNCMVTICFEQIYPYSWKLQSVIRPFRCTSDNTCICYGRNNGFTKNDWQEKHIFVYLVDFDRLQILQFLQGHPKKSLILYIS